MSAGCTPSFSVNNKLVQEMVSPRRPATTGCTSILLLSLISILATTISAGDEVRVVKVAKFAVPAGVESTTVLPAFFVLSLKIPSPTTKVRQRKTVSNARIDFFMLFPPQTRKNFFKKIVFANKLFFAASFFRL